jgi:hypothetical protein
MCRWPRIGNPDCNRKGTGHSPLPSQRCRRSFYAMLMGMESPDTRREADDSYRAQCAGRSLCATGRLPHTKGVTDGKTSGLFINRALVSWVALDRGLDRLLGRCAPRPCNRDVDRRFGCRRFRIASGKPKGQTMNLQFIVVVAFGGAIGSVARYLVAIGSGKIFGINFPRGILIINVTGSFLIGAFAGLFATKWDLPKAVRLFLTVGICGG